MSSNVALALERVARAIETMTNGPSPKQSRRVIQIAISQSETDDDYHATLVALCNDGTMWEMVDSGAWRQLNDIPQNV